MDENTNRTQCPDPDQNERASGSVVIDGNGCSQPILIVNADDFGLSSEVNRGIIEAHTRGILTSTTLLANSPAFSEAVELAGKNAGLGVGVHLNLVRGRPLSPAGEVPLLVDSDGMFRRFRVKRLTGEFLEQAEAEYRRQLRRVIEAGVTPTHIDFEKHHAWQGPLYIAACRAAKGVGVGAVRNLREPVLWSGRVLGWPGVVRMCQAVLLRSGFDLGGGWRGCGLVGTERMLGQSHIGGMNEEVWVKLAARLPGGVSEVMTHPGFVGREGGEMGMSWLGEGRRIELEALVSGRVRKAIEARGVRLAHYGMFAQGQKDAL